MKSPLFFGIGFILLLILWLPLLGLPFSTSGDSWITFLQSPILHQALFLSIWTSLCSLGIIMLLGTPLAWWLHNQKGRRALSWGLLVEIPIILPPAVTGIALLRMFAPDAWFGSLLTTWGISISFTPLAVILAQIMVGTPFYVQGCANAFRSVPNEALTVAQTLGASPIYAFFRVAIPIARPGIIVAAALAWARALGEFGATLVFAGNMMGKTQTLPLAIFFTMESNMEGAVVLSIIALSIGTLLLFCLHIFSLKRVSPS